MQNVIVSIATYGEGEMPDNAQLFWEALSSEDESTSEYEVCSSCPR